MSFALQIKSVCKKYASNLPLILSDFDLEVKSGEIVALLGESGSGKTTLLRLISGLEYPTEGEIFIHHDLVASETKFISPENRQVGLVFQDYALFPHMSIQKNVVYGVKGKKQEQEKICKEMLNLVGLSELGKRFPHEISGGQQQRVALARALATQPKLLLLDEPFSNLDEGLKVKVRADLREIIKKAGTTAIFVTHDTQDAMAVADKIALLNQGKLAQYDSPEMLYQNPESEFVAGYFGKVNWLTPSLISKSNHQLTDFVKSNQNPKQIGFRPHQFQLTNSDEGIELLVESISYYGNETEIIGNAENQQITIRIREHFRFSAGDSIRVKPVGEAIFLS
ncbi:MAG: iron(III) transport system ATP-binding protein [Flammeovirgaceae bacterium]|jgi:iron(III) transport system ATP-binding protein